MIKDEQNVYFFIRCWIRLIKQYRRDMHNNNNNNDKPQNDYFGDSVIGGFQNICNDYSL